MNRKHFITALAGIPTLLYATNVDNEKPAIAGQAIIPPYLKPGDLIAITSPAGFITMEEVQPAVDIIKGWGYQVKIGNTIGRRDNSFGGSDAEREEDFQSHINDPAVKAILCARGGYGAIRIIDRLKFSAAPHQLKWIIGFSDITVLHAHLNRNFGIASIHSKMCNSFPETLAKADPVQLETILSIRDALQGKSSRFSVPPSVHNKTGKGKGNLVGGNLKTLETLAGSSSDLVTRNKILFVEDTGEYLYSIDRMFWNLKRSGKLDELQGLIIGGFRIKPDLPGEEFGKSLYEIVLEKVNDCNYPVCFDFPVGHQKNNYALKCGLIHELNVSPKEVLLKES